MRSRTAATRAASGGWRTIALTVAPPPLLEERRDVELVVSVDVEVVDRRASRERLELVVHEGAVPAARQRVARGRLALVPPVEARGDHRDAHLVAHLVVDYGREDHVVVGVGDSVADLGRLVVLELSVDVAAG